jgi:hypothetical protein
VNIVALSTKKCGCSHVLKTVEPTIFGRCSVLVENLNMIVEMGQVDISQIFGQFLSALIFTFNIIKG